MLLALGLLAVAGALLLVALVVVPAGPPRVPLSRLDPTVAPPGSPLAGASAAAGAAVERVLARRGLVARGTAALERAGVAMALSDVVLLVGLAAVLLGVLGLLLGGPLLAVPLAVAAPLAARLVVRFRTARRQAAFADALDDSLQLMASSLRAGHSLLRAVDAVAQEAAAPTSEEFTRIVNETRVGRDLGDALEEVAERTGSEDFRWVAQAIGIHREVGGNLAEVLDTVGHTIRERNAIRRQVKALSAEGKLSAVVLMSLPFGIVAFLAVTNPAYLSGFTEGPVGWGMAAMVVVLLTVGGLWLRSTVRIRF
ncbi:type II secretion system F family protein [Geodermatophilus sp. DSM 44513]|uniref:type II secretion system F family protein n=1 Tax=Geodermatophilus sp. DSM 44513 TaxID=1528104 RepID=UPI00128838B9|nr:type II secretion system F family protein [Geodermatophilus sp. DSM 44513]WNV77224.1 type II secretion system F family protein [Geodermatophilus sp. DSM 44513]